MALFRGLFVRKDATRGTTPVEARKALAGLLAPLGPAGARAGILGGGNVVGTSGWAYSVPGMHAVLTRGASDGAVLAGNDGALSAGTDPAPASGSRIDIVWMRHADVDAGDATSDIEVGVAKGAASGTPQPPAIPAGALELARATVGSGATNTLHANVTIQQTGPRTALRGTPVPVRDDDERDAYAAAHVEAGGVISVLSPLIVMRGDASADARMEYTEDGTTWKVLPTQTSYGPVTPLTGWGTYSGFEPPRLVRTGREVTLVGGMLGRATAANLTALNEYDLIGAGGIPSGWAPPGTTAENRGGGWLQNGTAVSNAQVRVKPNGSVTYIPISNISLTIGSTRGYLLTPDVHWTLPA
ncbi:hypothetical protein [Cellulosimicrobium protaetiae]